MEPHDVNINKIFYQNIPLNQIQGIKKMLTDIKTMNYNSINYDFIKNKVLIDENINIYDEFIKNEKDSDSSDSIIEEVEEE